VRFIRDEAEPAVATMNVWIIYRRDRFLRGSYHGPFLDQRYPAVRFTEPNEDFRHEHQNVRVENGVQFGDLEQFLDYDYIANVARINAAALAALANGPAAPQNVKVEASTLSTDTQLEWTANTEPDLAGYEIVYRDTTEPFLVARDQGRQRHQLHGQEHHQGQLPLRRPGRRHRRQPERRHLPGSQVGTTARCGRSPTTVSARSRSHCRSAACDDASGTFG
jgi:hypothetical protein